MVRIQSPRAVRGWRSQSLDTRYYSRRWRRGGGSWCRHNFLRNNRRWFARQSGAGVTRPVFKRRFPTEINQHTDNKYFGKRSHGNMTFPKSGTQRNRELRGSHGIELCDRVEAMGNLFDGSLATAKAPRGTAKSTRTR